MSNQAELPRPPLDGQCQCGAIKYKINSKPHSLYICHCLECQRQSSSAFGMTLIVPTHSIEYTEPDSHLYFNYFVRDTDSGRQSKCRFCSRCGSRICHENSASPDWTSIKPGLLNQKVDFNAATHIWTKRMIPGFKVPDGAQSYEEEPPEYPVEDDALGR